MKQFDHARKARGETQTPYITGIMTLLEQFHRTIFDAFVQDGVIHSDVHLGNMIVSTSKPSGSDEIDNEESELNLVLFDVGQFERVSPPETLAILWTLVALSDTTRRRTIRDVAVRHLVGCSTVNPEFGHLALAERGGDRKWLQHQLKDAFESAISPFEDGSVSIHLHLRMRVGPSYSKVALPNLHRFRTRRLRTCFSCEKPKHVERLYPKLALLW